MRIFSSLLALFLTAAPAFAEDTAAQAEENIISAGQCHTIIPTGEFGKPVFVTFDAEKKEAYLTIVATLTDHNYGMNFNGFAKGEAGYTIPVGYKVKVKFCNNSPTPHSLIIVEASEAKTKINLGEEPYFDGGMTPDPIKGTTSKIVNFEFTVDEPGKFAFACGFPTHSAHGHWIRLDVVKDGEPKFVEPKEKMEEAK